MNHFAALITLKVDIPKSFNVTDEWTFKFNYSDRLCQCVGPEGSGFLCYPRFAVAAECEEWFGVCEDNWGHAKQLLNEICRANANREAEVSVDMVHISSTVVEAAERIKRRRGKGPPAKRVDGGKTLAPPTGCAGTGEAPLR